MPNPNRGTVHAGLRNPYDLRLGTADDTVFVENQRPGELGAGWQVSFTGPRDEAPVQQAHDALYAGTDPPAGVEVSWAAPVDHDPMYENYQWVAMLQPLELGRGQWHDLDQNNPNDAEDEPVNGSSRPAPCVVIHRVWSGERHDRDTWWAEVSPDPQSYEPQCACCPLLFNAATEARE